MTPVKNTYPQTKCAHVVVRGFPRASPVSLFFLESSLLSFLYQNIPLVVGSHRSRQGKKKNKFKVLTMTVMNYNAHTI